MIEGWVILSDFYQEFSDAVNLKQIIEIFELFKKKKKADISAKNLRDLRENFRQELGTRDFRAAYNTLNMIKDRLDEHYHLFTDTNIEPEVDHRELVNEYYRRVGEVNNNNEEAQRRMHEIDGLNEVSNELRRRLEQASTAQHTTVRYLEAARQENKRTNAQLQATQGDNTRLQAAATERTEENARLREEVRQRDTKLISLNEQVECLEESKEDLQNILNSPLETACYQVNKFVRDVTRDLRRRRK